MPSFLRIAGLALAIVLIAIAITRVRRVGSGSRVPAGGLLVLALGLFAVAAFPDLVRPVQDVLGLSGEPLGRLVTVLVVAVALAYILVFYALARADRANQRVSRLVRVLSAAQLESDRQHGRLGGILVCIPALNEADNLPAVIADVPATIGALPTHILVIDDGSTDRTADVARSAGALVVSHPMSSGQGAALQTGYVVAERLGVDIVVTLDADGQHDPAEMARLVEPIAAGEADFVVGSRRMGETTSESRTRDAGITVYTRLINVLGGTNVSDIANGYRAIR
ncbi:MAG TPA: glycosyltransferase family 2 protein, partial [Candidatus Acidoferrum sp.]|nr:glycosyltransferase family 2 protein [Candidatus Acidoferrum sp.]